MKRFLCLSLVLFITSFSLLFSQVSRCGTYVTPEQIAFENTFTVNQSLPNQSLPQLNRSLTVAFFVVKNNSNQTGVTVAQINASIDLLNQTFKPIAVSFKISTITYIDNYQLDVINAGQNELELTASYNEKNVINVYLVTGLLDQFQSGVCGLTYMPAYKKNSIFIQKSCLMGSSLLHQMGHFFDLYHTHETALDPELVVRPGNCSTAGDRCCDTEADPNVEGQIDANCVYTGTSKDANNSFYVPSAKNIMSSSNDVCRCYFSNTQFMRIVYALNHFRSSLR